MGRGAGGSVVVDDVDALDALRVARRDGDAERRARAERRPDADLAAEDRREAARERQAEAGAAQLAGALGAELDELLERAGLVLRRQPRARVA